MTESSLSTHFEVLTKFISADLPLSSLFMFIPYPGLPVVSLLPNTFLAVRVGHYFLNLKIRFYGGGTKIC